MCDYISVCASTPGRTGEGPITLYIANHANAHCKTAEAHGLCSDEYLEVEWTPCMAFPSVRYYNELDRQLVYDRLVAQFTSFKAFEDAVFKAAPWVENGRIRVGQQLIKRFTHGPGDSKKFPKPDNMYVWEVKAIRKLKEGEYSTEDYNFGVQRAVSGGWAGMVMPVLKLVRRATEEDVQKDLHETAAYHNRIATFTI